jgi:hypothetical protein
MQVMLDHPRGLQRDLYLLMRPGHAQIRAICQRRPAQAQPLRE